MIIKVKSDLYKSKPVSVEVTECPKDKVHLTGDIYTILSSLYMHAKVPTIIALNSFMDDLAEEVEDSDDE